METIINDKIRRVISKPWKKMQYENMDGKKI